MRCLIGESRRATRSLLEKILKSMDHDLDQASDGEEALELYENHLYDTIFLNWEMPKMSGLELAEKIRETEGERPYIFITASEEREDEMIDALKAGADDLIVKPFGEDQIRTRVKKAETIIEGRESPQKLEFDPVLVMEDEHKIWKRLVNVFQVIVSKIDEKASENILNWISSSTLTLDSEVHHEKEMYFLLNFLDNAVEEQGETSESKLFNRASLKSVDEEHEKIERLIDDIQSSIEEFLEGDGNIDTVKDKIDTYSSLASDHIEREERFLFPLAKKYFYDEDLLELRDRFGTIEKDAGEELEKLPDQIKRAEEILGIQPEVE